MDDAAALGADAVILADIGVLDYASRRHPDLRLHLSVQAAASNPLSLDFYRENFGIRRAVLPRVLEVREIAHLVARMGVEAEVFAFGSLGTMAEGRCILSSYLTGRSPSSDGVCAPAEHVSYERGGWRDGVAAGRRHDELLTPGRGAAYPTPCKARWVTRGVASYLFDEPVGLNADRYPAATEGGRRHGAEDRGAPAQPRLCRPGGAPRSAACWTPWRAARKPRARRRSDGIVEGRQGDVQRLSEGLAMIGLTLGPLLFHWPREQAARFLFPHRRRGAGRLRPSGRGCLFEARAVLRRRPAGDRRAADARRASRWCCRRWRWSPPTARWTTSAPAAAPRR